MKRNFTARPRVFIAAAGLAAALVATPLAAFANMNWSDENIAYARGFINESVAMLQHDDRDYGGHRQAAVNDLNTVESNLTSALLYDSNHDRAADPGVIAPRTMQTWTRGQGASNQNIEAVDAYLQQAASMLQQDQHDYDGFRVKAIAGLERARAQLRGAIAYIDAHPADSASDRNMQYARWYIERGIDQLQNDRRDYDGHRVTAMANMQQAREDILQGLQADANDPRFAAIAPPGAGTFALEIRSQNGSNENLEYVRGMVQHAVAMLNRDSHDYNGYRVKAIGELGQARMQLNAALAVVGESRGM